MREERTVQRRERSLAGLVVRDHFPAPDARLLRKLHIGVDRRRAATCKTLGCRRRQKKSLVSGAAERPSSLIAKPPAQPLLSSFSCGKPWLLTPSAKPLRSPLPLQCDRRRGISSLLRPVCLRRFNVHQIHGFDYRGRLGGLVDPGGAVIACNSRLLRRYTRCNLGGCAGEVHLFPN